jgi:hypothetical protein
MAAIWTFRSYVTARGIHVLQRWYDGLSEKAQARFDTRLRYLQQQPVTGWTRPYFDFLTKKYAGLGKVRLEVGNVQHRPLGFISAIGEFTFVYPEATERGGKWEPRNARDIAANRRQEIRDGRAETDEFDIE